MPPDIQIPDVPQFLGPEEWARKQQEEAERAASQPSQPEPDAVGTQTPGGAVEYNSAETVAQVLDGDDTGPAAVLNTPDEMVVYDDALSLVHASDQVDELFRAMLLAARMNASDGVAHLAPSIGTEYTRVRLALESLRAMIADEDTADTLGPVAVGIIDHLTSELLAWLDGSRPPFDGTPADLDG